MQKFWPLIVLGVVGLATLALLTPRDEDGKKDGDKKGPIRTDRVTELVKEDIKEGDGDEVQAGDRLEVHYVGTRYKDGVKFDSSRDRGEPFPVTIGVGQVIPGWDQGVPGMKVGGIRKLIIPARLAYAERGAGAKIPPDTDLQFEIEVVKKLN
ncbi:MAG: FKBP-type peptidyl-prolyl cis-trans isomerase [Gemmataceae bacterium]